MNRENLTRLRDFADQQYRLRHERDWGRAELPELAMGTFAEIHIFEESNEYGEGDLVEPPTPFKYVKELAYITKKEYDCRTSCCAIGYTPLIEGMPEPVPLESWGQYSDRVYGIDSLMDFCKWSYVFGGEWKDVDDRWDGLRDRVDAVLDGYEPGTIDHEIEKHLSRFETSDSLEFEEYK